MPSNKPDWKTNENIAVGKGATVQEFLATVGDDKLQIDVAPWGEGHLRSMVGKSHTSTTKKTGAKRFGSSKRLLIATWRSILPKAKGNLP